MKRVMKPLKEFNSNSENGLNIEIRLYVLGATTGDPTHDKIMWKRTVKQGFRTQWAP